MSKALHQLLTAPRSIVMGILNVTPDSFSDGGNYLEIGAAKKQIELMLESGADIIDIGGESTRPGADEVSLEQELERVVPLIELAKSMGAIVSVDTSKPKVMQEAISLGADLINDVRALQEDGAIEVVSDSDVYVCLMHMQGQPRSMQLNPHYDDVVTQVQDMLRKRIAECVHHGIERSRIIIDPGFGFGKDLEHNCRLMNQLDDFLKIKLPVLVGVSRKTMIGQILDKEVDDRMLGSVVAASYAAIKGAKILRVHDVKETVEALKVVDAFEGNN